MIFDIDPTKIKKGTTLKGKRELEEDGENLPIVLKEIVASEDNKKKFLNIIGEALPFIEDWQTDTLRDQSVFLEVLEKFTGKTGKYLPSDLISDGTLNIIALIVILYFDRRELVMVEEPEKNLHPALIAIVVEMMDDMSGNSNKQVFTTTHNVEFIKNSKLENIFLVTRDSEGFSTVEKPDDSERIRSFLQEGMGLDKLYVNNILEEEI